MHLRKLIHIYSKIIIVSLFATMFFSCNLRKSKVILLSKNEVVVDKHNFKFKNSGFEKVDIEQIIKPKPNTKFLFIPFKRIIYNLYSDKKVTESELKKNNKCNSKISRKTNKLDKKLKRFENKLEIFKNNETKTKRYKRKINNKYDKKEKLENKKCEKQHWSKKFGEAPVTFSVFDKNKNIRKLNYFLQNRGYYKPYIKFDSSYRKNKIFVKYIIYPGKAHKIDNIYYKIDNEKIRKIIDSQKNKSLIKQGNRLDINIIEAERKRISDNLKNLGYFTFLKDYIFFTIDTIGKNKKADITINISNLTDKKGNEIILKKHKIKNVNIYPNYNPREALIYKENYYKNLIPADIISKKGKIFRFFYKNEPKINEKSIIKSIYVAPGDYFNLKKVKTSYKRLSSIQIIQTANISFKNLEEQNDVSDSIEYIDCNIKLSQDKLHQYEFSIEASRTSANYGLGGYLNYTNNNIFRNTEVLNIKFNGEIKRIQEKTAEGLPIPTNFFKFNSKKYGVSASINFPRLFIPEFINDFVQRTNPRSIFSSNFNITKRPDFSMSVISGAFGYQWNSAKTIKHSLSLVSADFMNFELHKDIYAYRFNESYEDRFIFGSSYKFTFNNQLTRKRNSYFLINAYSKAAGNSLRLGKKLLKHELTDGSYSVANNVFAQFFKTDLDIRFYTKTGRAKDNLAMRLFTGFALPYGNLKTIPVIEQYFSGGVNGIRAWQERSLGPGSYVLTDEEKGQYPKQRSDIKLEANFEYRMNLIGSFDAAFFIDAGNIWAINKNDPRDGAFFKTNKFYKEIAIGSGFGIRYDFSILVIRLDIGLKIKDPALPEGNRWIPTNEIFRLNNSKFNFGIGYPF